MIEKAQKFAAEAHKGQMRSFQGIPYVWHAHTVSKLADIYNDERDGPTELVRVAAMLHDVVEDTTIDLDKIDLEFGPFVRQIVSELTNDEVEIKRVGKATYLAKKMTRMSGAALTVKLCDRLDNVSDYKVVPDKFRERYGLETKTIIEYLEDNRFGISDNHMKLIMKIQRYVKKMLQ